MDPVNLDTVRRNAFRILGLTTAASQDQIDSAVRMMRLTASDNAVPPTPRDGPWLGPVIRTSNDIEHAMVRLTNPESRAYERLWWYCNQPPAMDDPLPTPANLDAIAMIRFRHDAAVTTFCRLLISGAAQSSLNRWIELLAEFREIASSDDYFHWMLTLENAGDFEKRASAEEIITLQGQMPEQAAASLVKLADEFIQQENFPGAGRIIGMLNETSSDQTGPATGAAERILNRIEDELVGRCRDAIERIDTAWKTKKINIIKPACLRALYECDGILKVIFEEVVKWSVNDLDREQRARGQFLKLYLHIAEAYEACRDKWSSRQALMKSLPAAAGTPAEPRIRQRIDELASAKKESAAAQTGSTGRGVGRGGRWGLIAAGIILVNLLRVCSTSNSSSYDSRNGPPAMSGKEMQQVLKQIEDGNSPNGGTNSQSTDSQSVALAEELRRRLAVPSTAPATTSSNIEP